VERSSTSANAQGGAESGWDPTPRLGLLGGFQLQVDGQRVRLALHMQRLLAFLALQGRPLHRAYVAGRLWLQGSQEHAHGCLRTTVWRLSQLPYPVLDVTTTHVALGPRVAVDVRELEACIEGVLYKGGAAASETVEWLGQVDELLPDWYDDWVLQERERLRQRRLAALEVASHELIDVERYSEAAMAAHAVVASDPLRESACRLLIRSQLGEGNVAEAYRQFDRFRVQLRRELDLEPSPEMQELLREARLSRT
jgi:DNA-binding SARP family transcriptional activator